MPVTKPEEARSVATSGNDRRRPLIAVESLRETSLCELRRYVPQGAVPPVDRVSVQLLRIIPDLGSSLVPKTLSSEGSID